MGGKLTKYYREKIVQNALEHYYGPKEKELVKREHDIFMKIYNTKYAAMLEKIEKSGIPIQMFYRTNSFRVNANGYNVQIQGNDTLPVSVEDFQSFNYVNIKDASLIDVIQKHAQAKETNKTERMKDKAALMAKLNSITTLKKLKESWPEGSAFYKFLDKEPKIENLPAIRFEDINYKFGLPVEERE